MNATTYNPFRAANAATAYDFACTMADRLYWLDDNYIQPFYVWVAPQLREVAISGLYWGLITFIDISLWLIDTTRQFMARDAQAIALVAFAQAHAPIWAPAQVADVEDPWEVEAGYEPVEFSPSVAAQAFPRSMLLLAPASTVICGPVWNPAPKDIHPEVERLTRAAATPANTIDEPATALNVPGAIGGKTGAKASISKAKGGAGNARANAKPKPSKGDAEAVASTARRGRRAK